MPYSSHNSFSPIVLSRAYTYYDYKAKQSVISSKELWKIRNLDVKIICEQCFQLGVTHIYIKFLLLKKNCAHFIRLNR